MTSTSTMSNPLKGKSASSCFADYEEWSHWDTTREARRSDLLSEDLDEKEQQHMWVPIDVQPLKDKNDSLVERVVDLFQAVHLNTERCQQRPAANANRGEHNHTLNHARFPQHSQYETDACSNGAIAPDASSLVTFPNHHRAGDNEFSESISITELRRSASFMAQQVAMLDRVKKQQAMVPRIPQWLHEAARQDGRRIRIVTLNSKSVTRKITCIGCCKIMTADSTVEIVYCPACGSTFSPDLCVSTA